MKQIIILCALILTGCSSREQDWDSGAARQNAFQQERMEDQSEEVRNQLPRPDFIR